MGLQLLCLLHGVLEIHLSASSGFLHKRGDTSHLGKRYSPAFSNHQIGNLRDGHELPQPKAAKPDLWDSVTSLEPTQGCQKCDQSLEH